VKRHADAPRDAQKGEQEQAVTRKQQDHRNKSDLAAHYSEIGISAVAASARYHPGRHAVNVDRPERPERPVGPARKPGQGFVQHARKGRAGQ